MVEGENITRMLTKRMEEVFAFEQELAKVGNQNNGCTMKKIPHLRHAFYLNVYGRESILWSFRGNLYFSRNIIVYRDRIKKIKVSTV